MFHIKWIILILGLIWAPICQSVTKEMRAVENKRIDLECKPATDAQRRRIGRTHISRVVWQRNGQIVASFNKAKDSSEWWVADPKLKFSRSDFSLTISNSRNTDAAFYRCKTEFSENSSLDGSTLVRLYNIRLAVIGKPTPPGRVNITSFTSRTVTVSWRPSRTHTEAPIIQYLIIVSAGSKPNINNNKVVFSPGNGTTAVVSSLKPYSTYTFQAMAENLAGRSQPGQQSYPFRTKGEEPVAAPTIKHIYNATNTSLVVTWDRPPLKTLHGPLVGFRLMAHELTTGDRTEYYVSKPHVNSYEVTGLKVYTKYMISVEVDNSFGYGPQDSKVVLTDEGVPTSGPIISNWAVLSSTSVEVTWAPPREMNGRLHHYTLYYDSSQRKLTKLNSRKRSLTINSVRVKSEKSQVVTYVLKKLAPYRKYLIWITASTSKGEGPKSETNPIYTDTAAPSAPLITNITMSSADSILVEWNRPLSFYRRIDLYTVRVTLANSNNEEDENIENDLFVNTTATYVSLRVDADNRYLVSVRAITQSIIRPNKQYLGPYSNKVAFLLRVKPPQSADVDPLFTLYTSTCKSYKDYNLGKFVIICDPALLTGPPSKYLPDSGRSSVAAGILAVIGCFFFVAFCIILLLVLYRKYVDNRKAVPEPYTPIPIRPELYDESDCPSIAVGGFGSYVSRLHADGDAGFSLDYQRLDESVTEQEQICHHSTMYVNKCKNRYVNILAYDHSRVVLRTQSGHEGSDYINANFIDGYKRRRAYIATQGPLPHTFGDFWRMVWEQRSMVIVMITNVVEKGRKKCDQYWPNDGAETYGNQFQVKLLNEYSTAYYVVRMFSLRNLKTLPRPTERVVFHYHYTHWPDHGVPSSPVPALSFVRKSSEANKENSGPMIVHCSAGVGRSGTYIVIDSMLKQIQDRSTVNVFAFLRHIRKQRSYLVQTEEQYIFCHEALLEAVRADQTEVGSASFVNYVDSLLPEEDEVNGKTLLQLQYELVTSPSNLDFTEGRRSCNFDKNRLSHLIPVDDFRVTITPTTGVDGSDYVNASFYMGFHKMDEFIVTQCPLDTTVAAFWRTVWEHNCQTLVLLCEIDDQLFKSFWPSDTEETWLYDNFSLQATESSSSDHYCQCMDFILQSAQDDFQLQCRLLHCSNWPERCRPMDTIWNLIKTVQEYHLEYQDGPIMVIDQYGGTPASTFCALTALTCQLEQDSAIDVYATTKLYHQRRHGVFAKCEDYYFLYECMRCLLKEDSNEPLNDSKGRTEPSVSVPSGLYRLLATQTMPETGNKNGSCKLPRDVTL